jgi:hypothetical protein
MGRLAVATYLILLLAPYLWPLRLPLFLGAAAPIGMIGLALFPGSRIALYVCAVAVGLSGAALRRPSAVMGGIEGSPGVGGVAGALIATLLVQVHPTAPLVAGAIGMVVAALVGEEHPEVGISPSWLSAGMVGLAAAVGLRAVEPQIAASVLGVSTTIWATGAYLGGLGARLDDLRLALAAPFAGAAMAALVGLVDGAMGALVWGGLGLTAGFAGGYWSRQESDWIAGKTFYLVALAGVGVAGIVGPLELLTLVYAFVLLGAGAVGLAIATTSMPSAPDWKPPTVDVPSVRVTDPKRISPLPAPSPELRAARMLLDAIKVANAIRADGLEELAKAKRARASARALRRGVDDLAAVREGFGARSR